MFDFCATSALEGKQVCVWGGAVRSRLLAEVLRQIQADLFQVSVSNCVRRGLSFLDGHGVIYKACA